MSGEDPNKSGNWASPGTGIDFLIRTVAQVRSAYDFDLHYALVNGGITGNVFRADDTDRANPLCVATAASYSTTSQYRVVIDPACIGRPQSLTYGALMSYNNAGSEIDSDTPDNGAFSALLTRAKVGYWLVGRPTAASSPSATPPSTARPAPSR